MATPSRHQVRCGFRAARRGTPHRAETCGRALALAALLLLVLAGCEAALVARLPALPVTHAATPRPDGGFAWIERAIIERGGPDVSGFHLLDTGAEALTWRLAIIDGARHTLDLQYYLWHGQDSGLLVLKRVMDAASRGVKVRLLVDDIDTADLEGTLAVVGGHPRVEVRLFNPFQRRTLLGRALDALERLDRLNYRMHNKVLIADNQAAIIGGRNIGDEYFGLNPRLNFRDIDVLGFGRVARQGSRGFDRFWNSEWVMPITALGRDASREDRRALRAAIGERIRVAPAMAAFPPEPRDWREELAALVPALHLGRARVPSDTPSGPTIARRSSQAIRELLQGARHEVLIVNPYVIPDQDLVAELRRLSTAGVRVRLLTNSLASQDIPAVSSHYKAWRRPLLEAGVDLYEKRPDAAIKQGIVDTAPTRSEAVGLHAKAIVVDRARLYIGSMNLDPRSQRINSETGVVVESGSMAAALAQLITRDTAPANAWRVTLATDGRLLWSEGDLVNHDEPASSLWKQIQELVFTLTPPDLY
ncbi:MAG: phospholipase D family protein [Alphaproteobacteria bacterium]|nr:phospholipase D family protein [Alphaproteobacteria bacterium]